jgi:hypothetical protein
VREAELDPNVIAFDVVEAAEVSPELQRPAESAHPHPRDENGQGETDGDGIQGLRSERSSGQIGGRGENERPAAL